jgi:hypothetical protein
LFLKATAACFREVWRIVDTILELASQRHPPSAEEEVSKAQAEDVVCVFSPSAFISDTRNVSSFLSLTWMRVAIDLMLTS